MYLVSLVIFFYFRQRREHRVFATLLQIIPGLEERLLGGSGDDVIRIAKLVCVVSHVIYPKLILPKIQKGASNTRANDTKSLKGPILDWITPQGQSLNPPLNRNIKMDRGFQHERTGALLCPVGLDWSNAEYSNSIGSLSACTDLRQSQGETAKQRDVCLRRSLASIFVCWLYL
jgi:hypothetical protein